MPILAGAAVVFVGLLGGNGTTPVQTARVELQLRGMFDHLHVSSTSLPAADLRVLTHHSDRDQEHAIVQHLHAGGVISCELAKGSLRVVVYNADGTLRSFSESSLGGASLSRDEIEVLESNLSDEVAGLARAADLSDPFETEPAPAAKVAASAPAPKIAAPAPTPKSTAPAPAPKIAAPAPAPVVVVPEEPVASGEPSVATASDGAGEAVSVADLESLATAPVDAGPTSSTTSRTLRVSADGGVAITGRVFRAGPSTLTNYSSTPVGAVRVGAHIEPTPSLSVAITAERTLAMSTAMNEMAVPTSIARWESTATYTLTHGRVAIAPMIGAGRRTFAIESTDPARSPDGNYNYLIAGAVASTALGSRVTLRGFGALEPVISGAESTEASFGEARRWALDVGAALEVRPVAHLFARAMADYQRFSWAWSAGSRGAGGATDTYPSASLSLGAEY